MYKELVDDIEGFVPPDHGYLVGWAVQGVLYLFYKCGLIIHCLFLYIGVLLLNACLTVREREPNSHAGKVSQ